MFAILEAASSYVTTAWGWFHKRFERFRENPSAILTNDVWLMNRIGYEWVVEMCIILYATLKRYLGPRSLIWFTLISAWIRNNTFSKVWHEFTYLIVSLLLVLTSFWAIWKVFPCYDIIMRNFRVKFSCIRIFKLFMHSCIGLPAPR